MLLFVTTFVTVVYINKDSYIQGLNFEAKSLKMNEKELLKGLQVADSKTLEYVYQHAVPQAVNFLKRDIKDVALIEDLVLSAMEALLLNARRQKIGNLKGGIGAYYMGIVKNLRLKHFEKLKKQAITLNEESFKLVSQQHDINTASDITEKENFESRIEKVIYALDQLPDTTCKNLILARYQNNVDPQELAEEHNMRYDALRQRLSRCMKALRKLL